MQEGEGGGYNQKNVSYWMQRINLTIGVFTHCHIEQLLVFLYFGEVTIV